MNKIQDKAINTAKLFQLLIQCRSYMNLQPITYKAPNEISLLKDLTKTGRNISIQIDQFYAILCFLTKLVPILCYFN